MDFRNGSHSIKIIDNIVYINIDEDFNEHDIKAITTELKLLIERFQQKEFLLLIDIKNCEGGTPEGYEESRKFNIWLDEQNLTAKAIVSSSSIFIQINESRVRDTNKQRIQYFENQKDAVNWLQSFLEKSSKVLKS
ncbi:MAG: hypothetical protein ACJA0T_001247 [Colwellia sp.]|jgi:hypothetical protein